MTVTDPIPADALPDEGGVLFDDDFDDEAPEEPGDRGGVPGAPAYDSGKILQDRGVDYPSSTPIGMKQLYAFLRDRWGGKNLGILSVPPRPMRGGSQPSLHCWGMALDWSWEGPGRAAADEVIEFLLANTGPLAIQAVHDYEQCRYWKSYSGWKSATKSSSTGFGQPWARWLHVERTWGAANDARTIDEALRAGGGQAPTDTGTSTSTTSASPLPDPTIRPGAQGANVSLLQDFLRTHGFADFARSDGEYGPRTTQAVQNAQTDFAGKGWYAPAVDGEYGPGTHAAAVKLVGVTALPSPTISPGASGGDVVRLQDFLRTHGFADFARSDGEYGPRTTQAVKNAQTDFAGKGWYALPVDGEYGPGTHAAALKAVQGG
jgi:peptidoglycan hydrolase-like protein with peptidoglycan-binding domain